ncbi:sensor histidine kinase [Nocardia goodfellowii]|uniref:Cell division protein FtsB n=1 Tax=Nocardia goodfellowii TaxID=882446 RepID=A0ABS4QI37_9NOCA|nr:hypothetical protein [Nocardia goodfellowii]MBP2191356.1 cell division protein FtsB [Nocardia goodfellowii]
MRQQPNLTYTGVLGKAMTLAITVRHAGCLLVAVVAIAVSHSAMTAAELAATGTLAVWCAARLWSRADRAGWVCADVAVLLGYLIVAARAYPDPTFIGGSAQVKIAAAVVVSIGMVHSVRRSAAVTALTSVALYLSYRNVPGVSVAEFLTTFAVWNVVIVWGAAVAVRRTVLRSADAVDASLEELSQAKVERAVLAARRRHEREQWAVLHDTAASTLLMVSQGAPIERQRLAEQARRDLAVLAEGVPVFSDTDDEWVDLVVPLRQLASECRTPLSICGLQRVAARRSVAWAVSAAVREALTNVDRHAQAQSVRMEIGDGRVHIVDDGVGFADPSDAVSRHGIRRSIIGRMRAVGGAAEVTAAPAGGTRVTVSWTESAGVTDLGADDRESETVAEIDRLASGLGYAIAGVAIMDTLLQSGRAWTLPMPALPVAAILVGLNVALALIAVLIPGRSRRITGALMVVALSSSPLLEAVLPLGQILGGSNWTIGAVGWTVVALGVREPAVIALSALSAWWALAGLVIAARDGSASTMELFGFHTATILFLQMFIVVFAASVHRVVQVVTDRDQQRRRVVAAAAVDTVLKNECAQRYRDQLSSVLPLLRRFADSASAIDDPQVRATARTEYARLRRLFDRVDSMDHILLADLDSAIDRAEARGVAVTVPPGIEADADLPEPSAAARAEIAALIRMLLEGSRSHVRLVVAAEPHALSVSVLCDSDQSTITRVAKLCDEIQKTENESPGRSTRDTLTSSLIEDAESGVWLRLRCERVHRAAEVRRLNILSRVRGDSRSGVKGAERVSPDGVR